MPTKRQAQDGLCPLCVPEPQAGVPTGLARGGSEQFPQRGPSGPQVSLPAVMTDGHIFKRFCSHSFKDNFKKILSWEFAAKPAVGTLSFHLTGRRFDCWWGTRIPQVSRSTKKFRPRGDQLVLVCLGLPSFSSQSPCLGRPQADWNGSLPCLCPSCTFSKTEI